MQPQQTGVLFIVTQQVQPSLSMVLMQSQHAWIISAHFWSPLVQVTVMPLSVMSHLHMPIIRLQQQTIMPFIIRQQEHIPPAIMVQRFCIMLRAIWSSQVQVIFIPPWTFSHFMAPRGTIIMFIPAGMPPMPMPWAAIPVPPIIPVIMLSRSIIVPVIVPVLSGNPAGVPRPVPSDSSPADGATIPATAFPDNNIPRISSPGHPVASR
jgi:hypothetical protein